MESNNNIRPANLRAVAGEQNFGSDILKRAKSIQGLVSPGAQMNNTDNYKTIPIEMLVVFKGHPFQVRDDKELDDLAESINESGLMEAILVRPLDNGYYEILAGHRRVAACKKLGWYDINAKVLNVGDEEAIIIMTNTNLKRREKIFHSERAKAYRMQMNAYRKQGKRTDLIEFIKANDDLCSIGTQVEEHPSFNLFSNRTQVKSRDIVAELNNTSALQVTRYLRLNELIEEILDLVDSEEIPFNAGVALSFLTIEEQRLIVNLMNNGIIKKIDLKSAEELKAISKIGQLNETVIKKMFTKEDEKNKITAYVAFQGATKKALKRLKKDDYDYSGVEINQDELEKVIIEAIKNYAENKR